MYCMLDKTYMCNMAEFQEFVGISIGLSICLSACCVYRSIAIRISCPSKFRHNHLTFLT